LRASTSFATHTDRGYAGLDSPRDVLYGAKQALRTTENKRQLSIDPQHAASAIGVPSGEQL